MRKAKSVPINKFIPIQNKNLQMVQGDYSQDDLIDEISLKYSINDILSDIYPRERLVIEMFFGLNGHQETKLIDIAPHVGVTTKERVRQIREKALRRLRYKTRIHKITWVFGLDYKSKYMHNEFSECTRTKTYADLIEHKKWLVEGYERDWHKRGSGEMRGIYNSLKRRLYASKNNKNVH